MKAKITPKKIEGIIDAPPSKSMAHRLLISSALSSGETVIDGISDSGDMNATLRCLYALGAKFEKDGEELRIEGLDIKDISDCTLDCGESGSTLRFFIPLCLLSGRKITLKGSKRLFERPLDAYKSICEENSFLFEQTESTLTLCGALKGGEYSLRGDVSSQFISGLMFALPLCREDSVISLIPPIESRSYIDMTVKALDLFGVKIERKGEDAYFIKGGQSYTSPKKIKTEGDYSNSAFFDVFSYLGYDVSVNGLDTDSLQGDKIYREYFCEIKNATPTLDISNCPDLAPILMALAAIKNGATLKGTKRLKIKESDRGAVMAEELSKFGAECVLEENSITVIKKDFYPPKETLRGHNDHRIVMALCTLLCVVGGEIDGIEAVNKSLPNYFELLEKLGANISYEA